MGLYQQIDLLSLSWKNLLGTEIQQDYFQELICFVDDQYGNKSIFPKKEDIFNCLHYADFDKVKVVILGQDPYHGLGQANGLAFSVHPGIKIPPSLKNIFKELHQDLGISIPEHGDLSAWAEQGVLLLNSTLTVEEKKPGSHQQKGWEQFTDYLIAELSSQRQNLVFFLWGSTSIKKESLIDSSKHLIIKSPHPSPLSAYRGFFGQSNFSKCNQYLEANNLTPINWQI